MTKTPQIAALPGMTPLGFRQPKFTARDIEDLMTHEAEQGRVARKAKFVVLVEADDGSWFELDATDQKHAGTLARDQVDKMKARGASCWRVFKGGELHTAFSTYFWSPKVEA